LAGPMATRRQTLLSAERQRRADRSEAPALQGVWDTVAIAFATAKPIRTSVSLHHAEGEKRTHSSVTVVRAGPGGRKETDGLVHSDLDLLGWAGRGRFAEERALK